MRIPVVILTVALALLAFGCGGDDDASTAGTTKPVVEKEPPLPALADGSDPRFATVALGEGPRPVPKVDTPNQAPPEDLLVRDLKVGSGPTAHLGDVAAVRYLGVDYRTGKVLYFGWLYPPALEVQLSLSGEPWSKGVVGMRVGGSREIVVPSHLALGAGALDYVVELARVEPASKPAPGGA